MKKWVKPYKEMEKHPGNNPHLLYSLLTEEEKKPMGNPLDPIPFLMMLALFILAALKIQGYLLKRAITQVIDRFRQHNSLCSQGSKTLDQLDLQPPTFIDRMTKPRDYKPYALRMLIKANAVRVNADDKMCLLEHELSRFQQKM